MHTCTSAELHGPTYTPAYVPTCNNECWFLRPRGCLQFFVGVEVWWTVAPSSLSLFPPHSMHEQVVHVFTAPARLHTKEHKPHVFGSGYRESCFDDEASLSRGTFTTTSAEFSASCDRIARLEVTPCTREGGNKEVVRRHLTLFNSSQGVWFVSLVVRPSSATGSNSSISGTISCLSALLCCWCKSREKFSQDLVSGVTHSTMCRLAATAEFRTSKQPARPARPTPYP